MKSDTGLISESELSQAVSKIGDRNFLVGVCENLGLSRAELSASNLNLDNLLYYANDRFHKNHKDFASFILRHPSLFVSKYFNKQP
jgi:hypothetical protein